jgi:hypothetical protein
MILNYEGRKIKITIEVDSEPPLTVDLDTLFLVGIEKNTITSSGNGASLIASVYGQWSDLYGTLMRQRIIKRTLSQF